MEDGDQGGTSFFPPVRAPHPPLSVVRRFAHLLNQSQQDFLAEAELLRLQEEVVRKIRSNQQLEHDLNLMDIKIGLLVKNRITLQVGDFPNFYSSRTSLQRASPPDLVQWDPLWSACHKTKGSDLQACTLPLSHI